MATALNAIGNATGRGCPSRARALFGNTSLDTIVRLAIALDIPTATILSSSVTAKAEAAAANPALDALAT